MKRLLLFLLWPVCIHAQEVQPVISRDYLALINKDSLPLKAGFRPDTTNSLLNAFLKSPGYYSGGPIRRIEIKQDYVHIKPAHSRILRIGGGFSSTVEIKSVNRLPALQSGFVQGRSDNGQLVWRGPETGELFSYGPAVNTLEFDGSNYAYDTNGRLVKRGAGNGKVAQPYDNSLFRTTALTSQSFNVQGKYFVGGRQVLNGSIKLSQRRENIVIPDNTNKTDNLVASLGGAIDWLNISATYNYIQDRFSNSNRNGFLNRVYQNALLSPVSFDNGQGYTTGNLQRSYSPMADNPFFLLAGNGNSFRRVHKNSSLVLEKKTGIFRFKITQSEETSRENSHEGYKAGTAFFSNGAGVNRKADNTNYFLRGDGFFDISYGGYRIKSTLSANYIYANNRSSIDYLPGTAYRYQRSSNDFSVNYQTTYYINHFEAGLNLGDKFYSSNTATSGSLFLPAVSGFVRLNNIMDYSLTARLSGSFNRFYNELPVDRSFSSYNLLQHSTQQALQYFPVTEVNGFDNLQPIRHQEWTGRLELYYENKLDFYGEIFRRNTYDDVFPVLQNGQPVLKNLASHRNDGIELQLALHSYSTKLRLDNRLSFYKSRLRVTDITDGYNFTPVAGFSDVYKALVKGEAPGVIVGSSYLKDAHHNRIIGNDGFPMVNTTPSVLANPLADFVMKLNNMLSWKWFTLSLDWEWKKGGSAWNGTEAVLDYYGRSETSGQLRHTSGYVFSGVMQDGHANNKAVSFYDPALPVDNNRWTRYGYSGVGEAYIQKTDWLRLNNISLCYKINSRKYIKSIAFTLYASNMLVWSAYKGVDPNQLLYDQANTNGLDFFNLPSTKSAGFNLAVQF